MISEVEALHIIESLRSGISSPRVCSHFPHGRQSILDRIDRDLSSFETDAGPHGLVVSGSYGQGKTHLLHQIAKRAQERNFAIATVVLGRETPFHRLSRLYQKAANSLVLPDTDQPGLECASVNPVRPISLIGNGPPLTSG